MHRWASYTDFEWKFRAVNPPTSMLWEVEGTETERTLKTLQTVTRDQDQSLEP